MKKHATARRLDVVLQPRSGHTRPDTDPPHAPGPGGEMLLTDVSAQPESPHHCRSKSGLALGAQVGESRIRDLVTNAGLSRSAGSARHHSTSCSRPGHSRPSPTSVTVRPGPEPPDQLGPQAPARGGEGLGWGYLPVDAARAGIPTVAPTPTGPRELQSRHGMQRSRRMEGHQ